MSEIEKFDSLIEEYGKKYVDFLKIVSKEHELSFEHIYYRLPSSKLIKKDLEYIDEVPVAGVLMGVAMPATFVLSYYCIVSECPSDYPEQPSYYISTSEGRYPAPFTKKEFLKSIEEEQSKKIKR